MKQVRKRAVKKPIAKLPNKEQRQYEHIKESHAKKGDDQKKAKRIAAATVKKTRSMRGETKC